MQEEQFNNLGGVLYGTYFRINTSRLNDRRICHRLHELIVVSCKSAKQEFLFRFLYQLHTSAKFFRGMYLSVKMFTTVLVESIGDEVSELYAPQFRIFLSGLSRVFALCS